MIEGGHVDIISKNDDYSNDVLIYEHIPFHKNFGFLKY